MMKHSIEDADSFIGENERVVDDFMDHQQEQMIQLLQNICNEYNVTMNLLHSTILFDEYGREIDEGKVYSAFWNVLDYDECNLKVLGTMIIKPEKEEDK